jgi:hypothetical protein
MDLQFLTDFLLIERNVSTVSTELKNVLIYVR